jgi:hypothetical protein
MSKRMVKFVMRSIEIINTNHFLCSNFNVISAR